MAQHSLSKYSGACNHSGQVTAQESSSWELTRGMDRLLSEETLIFIGSEKAFECQISHTVMIHPVAVIPCGHIFDRAFLTEYIASRAPGSEIKCPCCYKPQGSLTFEPLPALQKQIRETVEARCPFEGCQSQMCLSELEAHMRDTCPHAR